jgi:hypothetical protein
MTEVLRHLCMKLLFFWLLLLSEEVDLECRL